MRTWEKTEHQGRFERRIDLFEGKLRLTWSDTIDNPQAWQGYEQDLYAIAEFLTPESPGQRKVRVDWGEAVRAEVVAALQAEVAR